ncbi:MAG: class I SAM-dependent methyltransferase [Bacteroidota bacterium]
MENEQNIDCFLCGQSAVLKHKKFPGYQEPNAFEIYHCQYCNTAFSLPRNDSTKIYDRIYENNSKVPGYDRYWDYANNVSKCSNPLQYLADKEDTYWAVKEALSITVEDKKLAKILEIGSGLGYLTYSLIRAKYNVIGLDISHTAVMNAINRFGDYFICEDLFNYAKLHSESFDIVILTEVIEHIDNPIDFLESINMLLKPNGRIIITTPNKSLYPKDIIWDTELPPVHCWWFSEDSIKYLSERINASISLINFSKFYKYKYIAIDRKRLYNGHLPKPFFSRNGTLIISSNMDNNSLKSYLRKLIAKIPFAKVIYVRIKKSLNTDKIICDEKGVVLCAILQKS